MSDFSGNAPYSISPMDMPQTLLNHRSRKRSTWQPTSERREWKAGMKEKPAATRIVEFLNPTRVLHSIGGLTYVIWWL